MEFLSCLTTLVKTLSWCICKNTCKKWRNAKMFGSSIRKNSSFTNTAISQNWRI